MLHTSPDISVVYVAYVTYVTCSMRGKDIMFAINWLWTCAVTVMQT